MSDSWREIAGSLEKRVTQLERAVRLAREAINDKELSAQAACIAIGCIMDSVLKETHGEDGGGNDD